ncbi:hypothetical protein TNCT_32471 [Trichonephila clavata]|uniref:Uncharacterized protein n=1 Tax=Trichonephila clavata TaxID=2740835 RepID=A0A8X6J745_TRICU|nr:hypothetical protein TNCT_32471 [Trichonephila clavata]
MNIDLPSIYANTMPNIDTDSVIMEDYPPANPLDHCCLLNECEKNAKILEMRARPYKDLINEEEKIPSTDPSIG